LSDGAVVSIVEERIYAIEDAERSHLLTQIPIPSLEAVGDDRVIAIDFETANDSRASACSIGIVWIVDGRIAHRAYRLIRPSCDEDEWLHSGIHGIYPEDVEEEPEFPEVWRELQPHLENALVLARNASFDMGVLRETLDLYGLPRPSLRCMCTLVAARRVWVGMENYKLSSVAERVGFAFKHHHALEDAEASAMIALGALEACAVPNLEALADVIGIRIGKLADENYEPSVRIKPQASKVVAQTSNFDESHPFFGKKIVVTGAMAAMTREEAMQGIVDVGGQIMSSVSRKTNYLVVGQDPGSKLEKAMALKSEGYLIEVLDERAFLEFLGSPIPRAP
jgi:DNA polymerase-3 subunit epsilon